MVRIGSGDLKAQLKEWVQIDGLNDSLVKSLAKYAQSLHRLAEGTKEVYLIKLKQFSLFLIKQGYNSFEDADKEVIDRYLTTVKSHNTANNCITILKPFYRDFIGKEEAVKLASSDFPSCQALLVKCI